MLETLDDPNITRMSIEAPEESGGVKFNPEVELSEEWLEETRKYIDAEAGAIGSSLQNAAFLRILRPDYPAHLELAVRETLNSHNLKFKTHGYIQARGWAKLAAPEVAAETDLIEHNFWEDVKALRNKVNQKTTIRLGTLEALAAYKICVPNSNISLTLDQIESIKTPILTGEQPEGTIRRMEDGASRYVMARIFGIDIPHVPEFYDRLYDHFKKTDLVDPIIPTALYLLGSEVSVTTEGLSVKPRTSSKLAESVPPNPPEQRHF